MKNLVAVSIIILFSLSFFQLKAQNPSKSTKKVVSVEEKVTKTIDRFKTIVTLQDDQINQLRATLTEHYTEIQNLRTQSNPPDKNAIKECRKKRDEEIKNFLTDDQYKTYISKRNEIYARSSKGQRK